MSLNQAVECAVDECIKEGILAEFLSKNRAEVISMSIFEYDKELKRRNCERLSMKPVFLMVKNPDTKPDFPKVVNLDFPKDKAMLQLKLPEGCFLQSNKFTIEEIAKFSGLSQQEVETISSDA